MLVKTKFFGDVECENDRILTFEEGIPGFEDSKRFVVLSEDENIYMSYLQSVDNEQVCFIITPPAAIVGNYNIELGDDLIRALDIRTEEDINLYAILNAKSDQHQITVNLRAPIVVNRSNHKAIQGILGNTPFEIRHPINMT